MSSYVLPFGRELVPPNFRSPRVFRGIDYYVQHYDEQQLGEQAIAVLRYYIKRYPQALPMFKRVLEEGRVNGSIYGLPGSGGPRCLVGWLAEMLHVNWIDGGPLGIDLLYAPERRALEAYILVICAGETPTTNSRLATLYTALLAIEQKIIPLEDDQAQPLEDHAAIRMSEAVAAILYSLSHEQQCMPVRAEEENASTPVGVLTYA